MKRLLCRRVGPELALALFFFLLLNAPAASAHGVSWELSAKKAYGLEFMFDDGSPMAFAEVKVFKPGEEEVLSQVGRADKNGYFAFIPDAEGQWTIKASDGSGHLAQAQVTVASTDAAAGGQPEAMPTDSARTIAAATKPFKIALVISVFLNLAAVASIWRRKKTEVRA